MPPDLEERRTERLVLRRPRETDLPDFCRMHRDERVMATLGGVRTDAATAAMLDDAFEHWRRHGIGWWTLRQPDTGDFVGRGGLRHVEVGGGNEMEIGYGLMAEYWGRGLATELARESARVAFDELGRADLVAFTLPHNRASQNVMEKLGMAFERDVTYAELPHVLYRLRAESWRARHRPARLLSRQR